LTEREMRKKLKTMIPAKRYRHSLGVLREAVRLAKIHGADVKKARVAALLHDCAKSYKDQDAMDAAARHGLVPDSCQAEEPKLLHAPLGVALARKEFGVEDPDVLSAIGCHTTGKENMTLLEKVIYMADMVEEGRDFPGVREMRKTARRDINEGLIQAIGECIAHVRRKGRTLHPDSVQALAYLENEKKTKEEKH
jgi:predicted HD superfamily hydrolase involved in NAD metabolism